MLVLEPILLKRDESHHSNAHLLAGLLVCGLPLDIHFWREVVEEFLSMVIVYESTNCDNIEVSLVLRPQNQ